MHAVRANRYVVMNKDFEKAYKNVTGDKKVDHEFYS
jgi:ATP-dependent 26S proteasome regulatory subunit